MGQDWGPGKMPTGIEGVDEITGGGLPRGRTTLVLGGAGSGKTVMALETLVNGARHWGEPGIFVAFEENTRHVIGNAASFGWDLPSLEQQQLFFLDARMSSDTITSGGFDLTGMLASLEAKAEEMGARRIVFDSIDVVLSLMDDPRAERLELYRIHDWLSSTELSGLVTARVERDEPFGSERYGFMQFMADCVLELHHRMADGVSLRAFRVLKYRGSAFAENEFPMVIGRQGVEVASLGMGEPTEYPVSTERVSTGVERLDTMLDGGYYRGTSVLVTGAPGTAKSTLSGSFVEAACKRGERALYVSFDEAGEEIVRNLASVNIRLQEHVDSGCLRIYSARSEARSSEEHLLRLRALIRQHRPRCMVVDPLSAMVKAGGQISALGVAKRLLHVTKQEGITLLSTSLLEGGDPMQEATPLQISTVADTWIHLSYVAEGGERNRALTIVKSRGTKHSNQVRELVLSSEGVTLADVYSAGGVVLMGSLRAEKEAAEAYEREQALAEIERRQREFELAQAESRARVAALERELELRRTELEIARRQYEQREAQLAEQREERRDMRSADRSEGEPGGQRKRRGRQP